MSDLQVFANDLFGNIRATIINNEPWFVAADIANALAYSETSVMLRRLDSEDMMKLAPTKIVGTNSMSRSLTVINESGLYESIFGSKLPSAKQFKRWVTSEILPQIRRTGGYIPVEMSDDDITIMVKAHQIMERTLQLKDKIIESKSKALQIAEPKAEKYDKLINAEGYMSFNVVAKQLGTGRNRLMKFLRSRGVLFRDGLSDIAYQT